MRTVAMSCLISAALLATGCSSGETLSSTPSTSGPTAPTSTTPTPSTTVPPTTVPPTTVAPTTVPPSTAPPTSPSPSTAPSTAPTTAPPINVPTPPTAFALVGSSLVEVDVASGEVVRVVNEPFDGDGIFRTGLRLTPDRATAYFTETYEDGWYDCTTSVGTTGRVDMASGEVTMLAGGAGIQLDGDASHTVHLASEACQPDPEAPDIWVLTPYDRAVVTDVVTGATTTYVTDTPPADYSSPSAVEWADLAPDGSLLVLTVAGVVHRIPPGATGAIQEFPSVATLDSDTLPVEVIDNSMLLAAVHGAEGSTDLITIDLADGDRRPYAGSETSMAIGVSPDGAVVVASLTPVEVADGAPVTVLDAFPDDLVYALDW